MSCVINAGNRYECAQQPRVYGRRCGATGVEVECEEAYGEMEDFAWYFVPVDEGAPLPVYRDQT